MKKRKLSSSMEDYLETIAVLMKEKSVARVKDISRLMNVKTSSVTSALNILSKNGLVIHERYGYVDLTPEGGNIAWCVQQRHNILIKFLTKVLKIDSRVAAEDACKMEHSISPQSLKKLTKFIELVETCPDSDRPDWLKSFDYYFKSGKRRKCKKRVKKTMKS